MSNLQTCYDKLKSEFPQISEPFQAVQSVEDHRNFWKPEKVKVLLLAESHVLSEQSSMIDKKNLPSSLRDSLPTSFAGVIYCLAYGEEREMLAEKTEDKLGGTPQFWKLFYSTVNQVSSDEDFFPILKGGTKDFSQRIENKIKLLETMQSKGVWLLDASIIAIYPKGEFKYREQKKILDICWEDYIRPIIEKEQPEEIIIIGMGVANILKDKTESVSIHSIKQPQGHRGPNSTQGRFVEYKKLYETVNA